MKGEDRKALSDYRLQQANHAIKQAQVLSEVAEWAGVVNRGYYAMFYAALALLITKDLGSSKHSGVLALIDREFVHPGILPKEMSMVLRDAFNQRQKSDYGEFCPTSEARAREILDHAMQFVDRVKEIVQKCQGVGG
ncbi:MAG: HEPN domain-containing protein [Deferrisomatales bacterium]|nr:HEPN domain-containing protein [Deferrisomatales bacterium]